MSEGKMDWVESELELAEAAFYTRRLRRLWGIPESVRPNSDLANSEFEIEIAKLMSLDLDWDMWRELRGENDA